MRISYEWLGSMVDLPADPKVLYRELIRTGTEVETIERVGADLDHVVVGQVVSKQPHPDSDHMWLCKVSVGARNVGADGNPESAADRLRRPELRGGRQDRRRDDRRGAPR